MTTLEENVKIVREVVRAVWTMEHHNEIDAAHEALDRILETKIVKVHDIEEFYKD